MGYSTPKDKSIAAQSSNKELVACHRRCKDWLQAIRSNIYNEFWKLNYYAQQDFIRSAVCKVNAIKRNPNPLRIRNFSFKYYFNCDGKPKRCCKKCFTTTLNVKEKFLRTVVKDMPCSVSYATNDDSTQPNIRDLQKIQQNNGLIYSTSKDENITTQSSNKELVGCHMRS